MATYYVNRNAQANGDHEVHRQGCAWMPAAENRLLLGEYFSCHGAVMAARNHYSRVDGCYHCSNECHNS